MGIAFGDVKGSAKKGIENQYKFKDGENILRLVGEVLPRYVYWLKGENNKDIPLECLAFDRNLEKFTNVEKDHVREFHPELKCTWSYVVQAIDPSENKVVLVNLKKKLFQQIKSTAEDLGDPTDPETGWAVHFKKEKTGPLPYNVEYTLQVLRLKPCPLTPEQRELIKDLKPIEQVVPRPTPELQLAFLQKHGTEVPAETAETPINTTDDLPQ